MKGSETPVEARYGRVRSILMLRVRAALPLRSVNGAKQPFCAAPNARGFDQDGVVAACQARARWCYRIERLIVPLCLTHAKAQERAGEVLAVMPTPHVCRVCGCTDADCARCIKRTGEPCSWVELDLCSACLPQR